MSSFYVENFGCRATQADGAAIEQQFRQLGFDCAERPSQADWVVLNTCAVTAAAEQDARAAIRRVRRSNQSCKIVITGCYAQRAPQEIAALGGISHIVGNSHKHHLAEIVNRSCPPNDRSKQDFFYPLTDLLNPRETGSHSNTAEIFVSNIFAHTELLAAPVFDSVQQRVRPNLKVQDGCDNRCSFCIIPSVRGRSRSLRLEEVLRQVKELVASGYREVVISGINLGRWGRDLRGKDEESHSLVSLPEKRPRAKFEDLIRSILEQTSVEKLRISSVEPMDWSDLLIHLMAESTRIAKHAHVPMQSASDVILRRMRRRYRPWHYREKIERIRAAIPQAAIGADVMVGFPGETDAQFDETYRMIETLPLTYLHVFTFSARPGTAAANMPCPTPTNVARERSRILRELGSQKKLQFMRSFIGGKLQAITLAPAVEEAVEPSTEALSDNYLSVRVKGRYQSNHWMTIQVDGVEGGRLVATACAG
ncbi:MAG: tRNA (N(6)-L-threonylcarbamoyladenosine(37)-C(2))-methylthiotransferase MtaB [Acidobacteria bacterium]|nr:tRNA (N(6)-L-threonylcarbamoyladenosine(37)-C(2))-methylthiotransferase MtaB [Acidobacteriota bacterium]